MKLSELIAQVGDENVSFQSLGDSLAQVIKGKRDARVTFYISNIASVPDTATWFGTPVSASGTIGLIETKTCRWAKGWYPLNRTEPA